MSGMTGILDGARRLSLIRQISRRSLSLPSSGGVPMSLYSSSACSDIENPNDTFENRRRRQKRCIAEATLVLVLAIALLIGLSVYVSQQRQAQRLNPKRHQEDDAAAIKVLEELEGRAKEIYEGLDAITPPHALTDPTTPQYAAFSWITHDDPQQLNPKLNVTFRQRYILATLYFASTRSHLVNSSGGGGGGDGGGGRRLQQQPQDVNTTTANRDHIQPTETTGEWKDWLGEKDECEWAGVMCRGRFVGNDDGAFVGISTNEDELDHIVDDLGFGSVKHMVTEPAVVEEPVVPEDGEVYQPVVKVDLSDLGLNGWIPNELGALSSLFSLKLSRNSLQGRIPVTLGLLRNLAFLHLDDNKFNGRIPASLGKLEKLQVMIFENNDLSGRIPMTLGNLTELRLMYLNNNSLTGEIPGSFGNLGKLVELNLDFNKIEGRVPLALCKLMKELNNPFLLGMDVEDTLPGLSCRCCGSSGDVGSPDGEITISAENPTTTSAAPTTTSTTIAPTTSSTTRPTILETTEQPTAVLTALPNTTTTPTTTASVDENIISSTQPTPVNQNLTTPPEDLPTDAHETLNSTGIQGLSGDDSNEADSGISYQQISNRQQDCYYTGGSVGMSLDGKRVAVTSMCKVFDGSGSMTRADGRVSVYESSSAPSGDKVWLQVGDAINLPEPPEVTTLSYSTKLSGDGTRVALSGSLMTGQFGSGIVVVFEHKNGAWERLGEPITLPDGDAESFGASISLSDNGDFIAVGAPGREMSSGQVYVFEYKAEQNMWAAIGGELKGSDEGSYFGYAVSLVGSGMVLAVGSRGGTVNVYSKSVTPENVNWVDRGGAITSAAASVSSFAHTVSLSRDGNRVAFGVTSQSSDEGTPRGTAEVWDFTLSSEWVQLRLELQDVEEIDITHSVSISSNGNVLVVGSPESGGLGRASLYRWENQQWMLSVASEGKTEGDAFGHSVSTSQDGMLVVVGAPSSSLGGYAQVFSYHLR